MAMTLTARATRVARGLAILLGASVSIHCGGSGDATGTGGTSGGATDGVLISGSISNLLGSGLVMQLNGGRDITPGPNNTFFGFTNIPKKTAYIITVLAQPTNPWQTCVVANGTGTATADNSTASVTCTTNTYAVRGTITGLTAAGLSLQLNGGAAQPIAAGSTTFAFPAVASGTAISVTIAAQPAGQTCTMLGGDGRIANNDFATPAVTCTAPGFTVGGDFVSGLSSTPATFRLNGGAPVSFGPGVDLPPFPTFTFPTTLRTGDLYSMTVASQPGTPGATCAMQRGKGKITTANITNVFVQCYQYGAFEGVEGAYLTTVNARPQFLAIWADGTYTFASRFDDPTCTSNGNGVEYGAYRRAADGAFKIRSAQTKTNGDCGLFNPNIPFANAPTGRLLKDGTNLTLKVPADTTVVVSLTPVPQSTTSLVGAWVRADGTDGTMLVFLGDGTYAAIETQDGVNLNQVGSWERGCYATTATTFTATVGASCTPDKLPSLDLNGRDGGFAGRGAISYTITGASTATIDGLPWRRMVPRP
jgi:hypothetical protein